MSDTAITFKPTNAFLSDLFITTVEGNYMSAAWARFHGEDAIELGPFKSLAEAKAKAEADGFDTYCFYGYLPGMTEGTAIMMEEYDESKDPESPESVVETYRWDREAVMRGLKLCAQEYPHVFARLMAEDYDILDADLVLQLGLLGEERYA